MQPLIGVTAGEILNKGEAWAPHVYGQAHTYTDAVAHAGGAPFILPLVEEPAVLRKLYDQCDGIVLSGGNDVDPALYHTTPSPLTKDISRRRDEQEIQLLRWALADNKPVLGICRGMQLLNVALGGSLYQDVATELPDAANHCMSEDHKDFRHIAHSLRIRPDSQLAAILQREQIGTNALHHQAVKQIGDGLVATAWSDDEVIEALELPGKRFVVAVQSHPEALEAQAEPLWRGLFAVFVQSALAE